MSDGWASGSSIFNLCAPALSRPSDFMLSTIASTTVLFTEIAKSNVATTGWTRALSKFCQLCHRHTRSCHEWHEPQWMWQQHLHAQVHALVACVLLKLRARCSRRSFDGFGMKVHITCHNWEKCLEYSNFALMNTVKFGWKIWQIHICRDFTSPWLYCTFRWMPSKFVYNKLRWVCRKPEAN